MSLHDAVFLNVDFGVRLELLVLYEMMDSVFLNLENVNSMKIQRKNGGQSEEGRSGHCRNLEYTCFFAWLLNWRPRFFFLFLIVKTGSKPHCLLLSGNENSITQTSPQRWTFSLELDSSRCLLHRPTCEVLGNPASQVVLNCDFIKNTERHFTWTVLVSAS